MATATTGAARRPRLTPHQAATLADLVRYSPRFQSTNGFVHERHLGRHGALSHLVDKGYAERKLTPGPRGGEQYSYKPL